MPKNGLLLLTPTSIASTGTSASINANGSVTFTNVTSLSLNGVFTSEYDNYMVVEQGIWTGSGTQVFDLRLRLSGTDAIAANYTWQRLTADSTSVAGTRASAFTYAASGQHDSTLRSGTVIWLYGPALAQRTVGRSVCGYGASGASLRDVAWTHSLSTAYDGLTMITYTSGMTGKVAVYGMRK